jgi:hypothetical protein
VSCRYTYDPRGESESPGELKTQKSTYDVVELEIAVDDGIPFTGHLVPDKVDYLVEMLVRPA